MSRALDKQEAVLYGRFVNAAYAMFKRDRTLLRPEPAPGDIPEPYELVAWLDISTICTFASPRVGNAEFVRQFNLLPLDSWRIVNRQDIVPKLPLHIPVLFGYEHVATPYAFSSEGVVKRNAGCWHAMSTYLHWLDPMIGVDAECKR